MLMTLFLLHTYKSWRILLHLLSCALTSAQKVDPVLSEAYSMNLTRKLLI